MKNLLKKEFRLVLHQTTIIFLCLSTLVLIPDYPYYVTSFYATLGIFFCCLTGRENNDIFYSMTLPIRKKDIVKGRFLFIVLIEIAQCVLTIPFVIIRQNITPLENKVGMDANIAYFGISLILLGIFNIYFLTQYYKNPNKVGKYFGISSVIFFVAMIVFESFTYFVPFFEKLDTPRFENLTEKIVILIIGIAIFSILTLIAYIKSIKSFDKIDL